MDIFRTPAAQRPNKALNSNYLLYNYKETRMHSLLQNNESNGH